LQVGARGSRVDVKVDPEVASAVLVYAMLAEPPFVPRDIDARAQRLVERVSGLVQQAANGRD